jgi:hypothetical protein
VLYNLTRPERERRSAEFHPEIAPRRRPQTMRNARLSLSCLTFAIATLPAVAWAQDAAPAAEPAAPAAPVEAAPAAPAAEAAPTEAAPAEAAPAAPAEEAPAEEAPSTPGWFRIDSDGLGLQLWVGATHELGEVVDLASDIYVGYGDGASYGEFDIGPAITLPLGGDGNSLILTPMAGILFNWDQARATTAVVPQLFTYLTVGPVYFESWIQTFINSAFTEDAIDTLYTRNFLLFKPTPSFGIGPHMEATFVLNDSEADTPASLPVGGIASVEYGKNNTLMLALGYETNEAARESYGGSGDRGVVGRFTFVRLW